MANEDVQEFNELVGTQVSPSASRPKRGNAALASSTPEGTAEISDKKDASMWAVHGQNFFPCDKAVDELIPGQYEVQMSPQAGVFFELKNTDFDALLKLPDSASEEILQGIEMFWKKEKHFRKFGFLWKRGVLLWGPPGSGKTSTIQLLSASIVEKGGIAVYVSNPAVAAKGLSQFRRIEPKRPCLVIIEDIDAVIAGHGEADTLALLDGELQIDNVVFVASTNYPERLDKRIVNRPSRFDIVKFIDMPSDDARRLFLTLKNKRLATKVVNGKVRGPKTEDGYPEIDMWVKETDGFSLAHLKELIVSVEVFEVPFQKALDRLKTMIKRPPKSTDANKNPAGHFV